jgi:hypothetical protein
MKRWMKDIVAFLSGFLLVIGLFGVSTTPVIAAERQQVQVTYQDSVVRGRNSCAKAQDGFDAKAILGHEHIFGGGMSVYWCWRLVQGPLATDLITTDPPHVNTWADARYGWSFDGISSKVKGHGTNCASGHCWEYYYFRYYFKFQRSYGPVHQTCTPFITITVRGNGSYVTGQTDGGIC